MSKAIGGYVRRGDRRYVPPVPDDGTRRVLGDRYCDDSENHAWGCVCAAGPYATFWTMMATSNGGETWPYRSRPQLPVATMSPPIRFRTRGRQYENGPLEPLREG